MADALSGFQDKLYWRQPGPGRVWHCFKKVVGGGYLSLCDRFELTRSGGQAVDRPDPWLRCSTCDVAEMKRRGWEESGPTRLANHPRSPLCWDAESDQERRPRSPGNGKLGTGNSS